MCREKWARAALYVMLVKTSGSSTCFSCTTNNSSTEAAMALALNNGNENKRLQLPETVREREKLKPAHCIRVKIESGKWRCGFCTVPLSSPYPPLALSLIALSVGAAVGQVCLAANPACGIKNLHLTENQVMNRVCSCWIFLYSC